MLGGPLGTLIGGVLGHGLDRGMNLLKGYRELGPEAHERGKTAFFTTTFSVMGHMAKVDSRVSEREIALAESVIVRIKLSPNMPGFPLDDVL